MYDMKCKCRFIELKSIESAFVLMMDDNENSMIKRHEKWKIFRYDLFCQYIYIYIYIYIDHVYNTWWNNKIILYLKKRLKNKSFLLIIILNIKNKVW